MMRNLAVLGALVLFCGTAYGVQRKDEEVDFQQRYPPCHRLTVAWCAVGA